MRIIWSPRSLRDLQAIHEYIAADSEVYGNLTIARIFAATERLSSFPYSGRVVPEMDKPQIREIIVGPFRVVYRVGEELIEVATVLGRREIFPGNFESCWHSGARGGESKSFCAGARNAHIWKTARCGASKFFTLQIAAGRSGPPA